MQELPELPFEGGNTEQGPFPELTDDLIEEIVDIKSVTQNEDVWLEAPAMAVLLALEVLSIQERQPETLIAKAKEIIWQYGNWQNKNLSIRDSVRQEMYQRNYEGEPWQEYYHKDGF